MIDPTVHPRVLSRFVRSVALTHMRFDERKKVRAEFHECMESMEKASKDKKKTDLGKHIDGVKDTVERLVRKERELVGHHIGQEDTVIKLERKIDQLEAQLKEERASKEELEAKYKDKITDMKKSFAYLKSKLIEFIAEKRERNKKLDAIHSKIEQHIDRGRSAQPKRRVPSPSIARSDAPVATPSQ